MDNYHRIASLLSYVSSLAVFLLCLSFTGALAQSEKDIVSRYKTAVAKNLDESSLRSMVLSGNFIVQKIDLPVVIAYKPKNLMRFEATFQNLKFFQVTNDSLQWDYNPMTGVNKVTRIDKENNGIKKRNSSFDFINYDLLHEPDKDHKLKLIGKEKLDSIEVYHLELTRSNKEKTLYYISTKNHLIYKIKDKDGFRYFANYTFQGGYVFPKFIIESNPEQYMEGRFHDFKYNQDLPDSLFVIPRQVLEEKKSLEKTKNRLLDSADSLHGIAMDEKAIELYTKAIQSNDRNFRAYNSRGLARIGVKEYYEAIADFNKAIEINPSQSNVALNNRGLAKFYLGDKEGAVGDYTKSIELDKTFIVAIKNRGLAYIHLGKYELGANDFKDALKINPQDGEAHFKLGVALAQLEKLDEALASYQLARKCKFSNAELYNYKGVSEYQLEKYDSAKTDFQMAINLDPDNLQYIENLGRALFELEDYVAANEQFHLYLSKKDDQPEIINLVGLCKYRDENYKGAIKDFTRSIELNGNNATYFDNRAAAKEMVEDYTGAIKDYTESIRIYPNDASVFYKRGMIKIYTSQKMEGCLDLATSNEMKYEPAKEAIMKNCN